MSVFYKTLTAFLCTPLLLSTIACNSPKRSVHRAKQGLTVASTKPTMLTLVLKSVWEPDSSVHFSIYNDIRNQGLQQLKSAVVRKRSSSFLLCFIHETAGSADSVYIDHPLKERVETKQGTMLKELFIREEAYTEVSVLYTPDMKKLVCTNLETQKQQILDIR